MTEKPVAPPDGQPLSLINHAIVYGAWCQSIEAQLNGLQQWFKEQPE